MCHWECIVSSPVSDDGGEGENKLFLLFKQFFLVSSVPLFPSCWAEETGEKCQSGTTAVIIFLWRCRWVVDLRELPWQDEQRVPEEASAPCEVPLLSSIEFHPDIASFMHPLCAHSSVFSSMPNDNDRLICGIIDMNHLYYAPEQLAADRCQKGQPGTRVAH